MEEREMTTTEKGIAAAIAAKVEALVARGDKGGDGFMGWLKPKEIIKRRKAEQALFRTGDYDANGDTIPIWRVDERGNLRGVYKTISGKELQALMRAAGSTRKVTTTAKPNWLATLLTALLGVFKR